MTMPDTDSSPAGNGDDGSASTGPDDAERAQRADRSTRGAMAGVLGLEAVVVLLVPRALAFSEGGLGTVKTVVLIALAVLMIAGAAVIRRPWGVGVGTVLQVLFLISGAWLWALLIVAAIFAAVWGRLLMLRHDLIGTPTGWRMLFS
jgi:hypothetical protein